MAVEDEPGKILYFDRSRSSGSQESLEPNPKVWEELAGRCELAKPKILAKVLELLAVIERPPEPPLAA